MIATLLRAPMLGVLVLAGCAGLRAPVELPDAQRPARTVAIRLHADDKLNTDAAGQPLALVARIYKLRQSAAFEQAGYDTFLSAQKEQAAFGADLLEVKEVVLVPGQHYEVREKVSREAAFLGVVALFHTPSPQRWRVAFSAAEAEKSGLTVGAHACALSVAAGAAPALHPGRLLTPVRCR